MYSIQYQMLSLKDGITFLGWGDLPHIPRCYTLALACACGRQASDVNISFSPSFTWLTLRAQNTFSLCLIYRDQQHQYVGLTSQNEEEHWQLGPMNVTQYLATGIARLLIKYTGQFVQSCIRQSITDWACCDDVNSRRRRWGAGLLLLAAF